MLNELHVLIELIMIKLIQTQFECRLKMVAGSMHEAIITGLQPDTQYQFQVAAYTRKGDGERSKPRSVHTKAATGTK